MKAAQHLGLADKISFSTLIDAYGKKQDFPNMEATLWEMQNAGHGGSSEAFNSILDAYGKAGHLEKLDDVLARMQKSGFQMDLETYNILINIYGRCAMFEKMEALFQKMQVSFYLSSDSKESPFHGNNVFISCIDGLKYSKKHGAILMLIVEFGSILSTK